MKPATTSGATVVFKEDKDALITRIGTRFNIHVYGYISCITYILEVNLMTSVTHVMTFRHGMRY